jgi:hypothetical protein
MLMFLLALNIATQVPTGCNAKAVHCVVSTHQTAKTAATAYRYVANQSLGRAERACRDVSSQGWVSWTASANVIESWNCPLLKQELSAQATTE